MGRRVVVKTGGGWTGGGGQEGTATATSGSQRPSITRRSIAPSLRKRKQIAPVVLAPETKEEEDNRGASKRPTLSRDGGQVRREQPSCMTDVAVRRRHPLHPEDSGEGDDEFSEESSPGPSNSALGSLFATKPLFNAPAPVKEEYSDYTVEPTSMKRDRKPLPPLNSSMLVMH